MAMAAAVPDEVMEVVSSMDKRLERLEAHMRTLLAAWSPAAMACLSPAERASTYMGVSKALNAVYCLFLRTYGESPDDHPVKSELDRVSLYEEKVQYACDKSKAPRPSLSLNLQAANRFIEHSIPDLSEEQKLLVREAGKAKKHKCNVDGNNNSKKRHKKESVAAAAAAFLAEASKEVILTQATASKREPTVDNVVAGMDAVELKK